MISTASSSSHAQPEEPQKPPESNNRRPPKPQPTPFGTTGLLPDTTTPSGLLTDPPTPAASSDLLLLPPRPTTGMIRNDSENNHSQRCFSVTSEQSRQSLHRDVQRLRHSLTVPEQIFLSHLCLSGNDDEILRAHETLLDQDLFPETHHDGAIVTDAVAPTEGGRGNHLSSSLNSHNGWNVRTIQLGSERSQSLLMEDLTDNTGGGAVGGYASSGFDSSMLIDAASNFPPSSLTSHASSSSVVGSEERQKALHERRNNYIFGKMWKAHQSGLAVTLGASRRSLIRNSSLSLMSSSSAGSRTRYRAAASAADEIFRSRRSSSGRTSSGSRSNSITGMPSGSPPLAPGAMGQAAAASAAIAFRRSAPSSLMDNRSDNNRRVSFPSRSGMGGRFPRAASITVGCPPPRPFPKPILRRMQSEGSTRNKVTFGESPSPPPTLEELPSYEEEGLTPKQSHKTHDDSSIDVTDVHSEPPPPLPQISTTADPIMGPPVSALPSHPPMRRDSMSSIPSLHMAHPILSRGSSVVGASQASYPSLHLAHHIGSVGTDGASVATSAYSERQGQYHSLLDDSINNWDSKSAATTADLLSNDEYDEDGQEVSLMDETRKQVSRGDDEPFDEKKEDVSDSNDGSSWKGVRPVLLRNASVNTYEGIGIEIQDSPPKEVLGGSGGNVQVLYKGSPHHITGKLQQQQDMALGALSGDQSRMESLLSFGDGTLESTVLYRSNSFDETVSHGRVSSIFRRTIRRSLSDADLQGIFLGGSRLLLHETSSVRDVHPLDESSSWVMDDESDLDYYDTWKVIEDEYDNGYGGGGTLPFLILGTSADDVDAHPHVLSPPLIESLQAFMPIGQSGNNFWMKYSLVRDGANVMTFLQRARGSKYTILALETVEGEVFGAFTTEQWRKNWNTFGGGESFLWRMRHSRKIKCHSIIDQAQKESIVDVYPYTGANNYIQFCTQDRIAVGGGSPTSEDSPEIDVHAPKEHEWGFGISLSSDLLTGTTSPCVTFGSPSLSTVHKDGSLFELINLELWTLTPCLNVEDAEKMELGKLFLEANSNRKLYL